MALCSPCLRGEISGYKLLISKERGFNQLDNLASYHKDTKGTKEWFCVLRVSGVKFQVTNSSSLMPGGQLESLPEE
jgi:hypothetical protein